MYLTVFYGHRGGTNLSPDCTITKNTAGHPDTEIVELGRVKEIWKKMEQCMRALIPEKCDFLLVLLIQLKAGKELNNYK